MKEILIATGNPKKRNEIRTLLKDFKEVKVLSYEDLDREPPIIVEDGKTFRQNAVKKAVIVSKFFDGLVLADDSGLEVNALGGKPGVRSARFARKNATDKENNQKLLKLLNKVPEKDRKARFVCNIALARNGHLLDNFEGTIKGTVIERPRGRNGFGYDPIFVPEKSDKTFAEIPATRKNKISHRGKALSELKSKVGKYLKDGD